jgi:hypothetical protein
MIAALSILTNQRNRLNRNSINKKMKTFISKIVGKNVGIIMKDEKN